MISIVASDGSGMTTFNLGIAAGWASFRPDGTSIAFKRIDPPIGLYLLDPDGSDPRPIVTPARGDTVELPQWSPDGRSIVYSTWPIDGLAVISEVRIVDADGTGDRAVGGPGPGAWEGRGVWSNRGDRLAMMRGYEDSFADVRAVSVNIADYTEVESDALIDVTDCCWAIECAPDDTRVLITPVVPGSTPTIPVLFDPQTGSVEPVPGADPGWATWQRLAPPES